MANNRMFLVHIPTGLAVGLGKRMGWGWYLTDTLAVGPHIEKLYTILKDEFNYEGEQDAFRLMMETDPGWCYGPTRDDGLIQLMWVEEKTA